MGPVGLIVLSLLALGFGVWLGLPGRYEQSAEDIEELMQSGGARHRRAKRVFTPLAWMQRKAGASRVHRRGGRQRGTFKLESPEDR